jgi:hypothetical protein
MNRRFAAGVALRFSKSKRTKVCSTALSKKLGSGFQHAAAPRIVFFIYPGESHRSRILRYAMRKRKTRHSLA